MRSHITLVLALVMTLSLKAQDKKTKPLLERPDLPGKLLFSYGYNFLQNNPEEFGIRPTQSKSVGLHYTREFFPTNKISFSAGLGFGFEKISFTRDRILAYNENGALTFEPSIQRIKKSKIATTFVELPIDFRFYPAGEGKGPRFFVGAGGYFGYLIDAHNKVSFLQGETLVRKERGDFNLNKIRYGVVARFGFDSFHFYGKYDLSKVFASDVSPLQDGNANLWSIGVTIDTF